MKPVCRGKIYTVPQSVSLHVMREGTFSQSPTKTRGTKCSYILDKMIKKVDWLSVEGLIVMRSFDHTVQSAWRQNISFVWFISKSFSSEGPDYFKSQHTCLQAPTHGRRATDSWVMYMSRRIPVKLPCDFGRLINSGRSSRLFGIVFRSHAFQSGLWKHLLDFTDSTAGTLLPFLHARQVVERKLFLFLSPFKRQYVRYTEFEIPVFSPSDICMWMRLCGGSNGTRSTAWGKSRTCK